MFIAVLYALVLIQFTEGNIEELQSFLFSIQDCINRIEQSTAPEKDRTWEYLGVFFYICGKASGNNFTTSGSGWLIVIKSVQCFLAVLGNQKEVPEKNTEKLIILRSESINLSGM